ncbi:MAG: tubulin-like doman-containing protein [Clostridia bacterium]
MSYYVIAVGGTGNKILESLVYGACADVFYTRDADGSETPIPQLHLLSVDVDAACGNTTRAKRAAEYYERVRETFVTAPYHHRGFHTALHVERWNMNLSKRAASVTGMSQNHVRDRLLARTLFSKTEASLEYSEGFRGHPDLGVLFFADLLKALDEPQEQAQPDELREMMNAIRRDIDLGETVKLVLCGSIFGGTGASGIPALSKYLRERFRTSSDRFELAAMLMLPYYQVPAASHDEELEIVVKSSTFMDKARTALQYYGMEGMVRDGEDDPTGVFDAIYLLGLPQEAFVTTRVYSTGSQSQENDAHMLEWLATRCISRFFRTSFRGTEAHHIDCYFYQWHTPAFSWQSFDCEAERYRVGYGALLKASAVFFAECYPTLRMVVSGKGRQGERVNYCAPYFHQARRFRAEQRARLEGGLDALYHFLAFYTNWMVQVVRSLPPTVRKARAVESDAALAAENYRALIDRMVLLNGRGERTDATAAERGEADALRAEYEEMQKQRVTLLGRIGGSRWLGILNAAQEEERERLTRQRVDMQELEERVALWHGEDHALVEAEALRQAEERLRAMRRSRAVMEQRLAATQADIEDAIRRNVVAAYPAPAQEQTGELTENELVNAEVLSALYALLSEYGASGRRRDAARVESAAEVVQKGLERLIVNRVPDRRDMAHVIAGLGGGECEAAQPDTALAGFLTVLLGAVMEE